MIVWVEVIVVVGGSETELTAATAVVQQWCMLSMAVAVDCRSGDCPVATAVGKAMMTM
jgi:hypothetical protein